MTNADQPPEHDDDTTTEAVGADAAGVDRVAVDVGDAIRALTEVEVAAAGGADDRIAAALSVLDAPVVAHRPLGRSERRRRLSPVVLGAAAVVVLVGVLLAVTMRGGASDGADSATAADSDRSAASAERAIGGSPAATTTAPGRTGLRGSSENAPSAGATSQSPTAGDASSADESGNSAPTATDLGSFDDAALLRRAARAADVTKFTVLPPSELLECVAATPEDAAPSPDSPASVALATLDGRPVLVVVTASTVTVIDRTTCAVLP